MTISDHTRHQLHQRLEAVLGPDEAGTLMAHLPPVGWNDVATRRDLDHAVAVLENKLAAGLADVRTELHTGLADVRTELAEVRTEMADVRADLHREIGHLRGEMGAQTRTLFLGLAGLQVSGIVAVAALAGVV